MSTTVLMNGTLASRCLAFDSLSTTPVQYKKLLRSSVPFYKLKAQIGLLVAEFAKQ